VANHSCPACRQTNVKLKAVAAILERKIERGKSVLRNPAGRTSPAMAKEKRRAGHHALYVGMDLRAVNYAA